jgi:hypothetical protein
MQAIWQRTGDPHGDFLRLTFIVEEALERLGAPPEYTLGEKVRAVENYLAQVGLDGTLHELWWLVQWRNRVVHERAAVAQRDLARASQVVRNLLEALAKQGILAWKELDGRLESLAVFPPSPPFQEVVIEPPQARAPEMEPRPRPIEAPRRRWRLRALALPIRSLPPLRMRKRAR